GWENGWWDQVRSQNQPAAPLRLLLSRPFGPLLAISSILGRPDAFASLRPGEFHPPRLRYRVEFPRARSVKDASWQGYRPRLEEVPCRARFLPACQLPRLASW